MSSASNEHSTIISESLDIFNDYYAYSYSSEYLS
jgi:hypothetical protein